MNLLFVEDNESVREFLGMLLESWGIEFDIASNGKEAVELATSNEGKYDICFMDTDMPVMNGLEATRLIRQNVSYFPILSTSGNLTYEKDLLKIGSDEFVPKPYDAHDLYRKILEWGAIRTFSVRLQENTVETGKEMPLDANHAKELKELANKSLCKMTLKGPNVTLIVHKNVPNKIAHDFIEKQLEISTFLDRDPDLPGECHLYKSSGLVPIIHFEENLYQEKEMKEDEEMKKYDELILKKKE